MITRTLRAVDALLRAALIMLMAVLVLSTAWQVTSRYVLQDPSSWTEELARFALIWAGLLGAVYAYRTHAHVSIDLFGPRLSSSGRRRLGRLVAACVAGFALAVPVTGGANLVLVSAELAQTSAALGVRMAWVYAVIPVSGVLLALAAACEIVGLAPGTGGRPEAVS